MRMVIAALMFASAAALAQPAAPVGDAPARRTEFEEFFENGRFDHTGYAVEVVKPLKDAGDLAALRAAENRVVQDERVVPLLRATYARGAAYTRRREAGVDAALEYLDSLPAEGFGTVESRAVLLNARASEMAVAGRYEDALPHARTAAQICPSHWYRRRALETVSQCAAATGRDSEALDAALDALIRYSDSIRPDEAMRFYRTVQRLGARTMAPADFWQIRLRLDGAYPPADQDPAAWADFIEILGVRK